MKPSMKHRFEQLLTTRSETQFFFILAGSVPGDVARAYDEAHGFGIKLSMHHNLTWSERDRVVTQRKTTHVFALYEDGTLTWTMLDQPMLTGLEPIQQALERFTEAFDPPILSARS
ncbi:MAG: hypothetical protein ACYDBJ_18575 [Aggregatilineales bacterium]